jgi:hypothetical protein
MMSNGSSAAAAPAKANGKYAGARAGKSDYIVSKTGEIRALLANAVTALRLSPEFRLAFDEFGLKTIAYKTPWNSSPSTWSDRDDSRTTVWLQHQGILVGVNVAAQAVDMIAGENRFTRFATTLPRSNGTISRGSTLCSVTTGARERVSPKALRFRRRAPTTCERSANSL